MGERRQILGRIAAAEAVRDAHEIAERCRRLDIAERTHDISGPDEDILGVGTDRGGEHRQTVLFGRFSGGVGERFPHFGGVAGLRQHQPRSEMPQLSEQGCGDVGRRHQYDVKPSPARQLLVIAGDVAEQRVGFRCRGDQDDPYVFIAQQAVFHGAARGGDLP